MNTRMVLKSLGIVILIEGLCMVLPLLVSLIYGQGDAISFVISILISVTAGSLLYRIPIRNSNFYARDGFAVVALSWIVISLFGSIPFIISNSIPSFIDAFFETVSGFTTTGSTILHEIETLPKGILFWRSFTQWMGGMGVLILTLAVLPSVGTGSLHIMKAEATGPTTEKLVPKLGQTAKILYTIYIVMTSMQIIFLLTAGMPLYDSLIHAFGSAATGGFSNRNLSVGAYNNAYIEIIITVFSILFGVNFGLYHQMVRGNIKSFCKNEEFGFYIGTILVSIVLITTDLYANGFFSIGQSLRFSSFQVGNIITTTAFSTSDFSLWPTFSKTVLVILMFFGGSAGSTSGGIKCIRILILLKIVKREISKIIHPRAIHTVKIDNKVIDEDTLTGTLTFFFIYALVFAMSTLVISIDGKDFVTSATSAIATLSNIGQGLGTVGPYGNFSSFSPLSKLILCFNMIAGRLEFLPMLVLFSPMAWKKGSM